MTDPGTSVASPRPALLVVDDDEANRVAISEVVSGLGADVVVAASGLEALRQVLLREFCAILMDVRMPGMDGYEAAAIIRQRERSRRIPVIFLTAHDTDKAQVFRGYSEGAVDYVFKPVEPLVLKAKVSVFVELYKQAQEIRAKAEQERRLLEENLRIRGERVETERRLRSSEKREAAILRSLPIAIYEAEVADQGVTRTFLHDDAVRRLLGFGLDDLDGDDRLWVDRIHEDDRDAAVQAMRQAGPGGTYSVEYRWRRADGGERYFLDQGVSALAGPGDRPRIFGTMFDVHDRRLLEQQLLHAQKLDAIGKLTGGIAHDFNNMLTVVIGNLDRMQRTAGLDERSARRVDHALQGALHCRDITRRLLGFARQQSLSPQALDLNRLINSLSDLVTRTLGERIEIALKPAASLWQTHCDPGQIEAALLNLLVNARDAMPDGGRVTIRTANTRPGAMARHRRPDLPDGQYVVLEVSDNGVGMPPEVLERACEAFFTTKEAGHGTGLGLSTIHAFVRQTGGDLTIESVPGRGTTVRMYLPRHVSGAGQSGSAEASGPRADLPAALDGEVVLVVEDEETVRRTAVNTLRELGYRVLEAGTAAAALKVLERDSAVTLLFSDVVMPGSANGHELAHEARSRWPGLKVLLTSAYDGDILGPAIDQAPGRFLRKPYRDYELAQAIRDAIA
ncbi:MAG: response regulator [Thalassobaculum sp.]|uniref:response regulator n=1 Tax=Thalassobaculum sp. TaxID=2022740 RepID=UPI0032EEA186